MTPDRITFRQRVEQPFVDCFGKAPEGLDNYSFWQIPSIGTLCIRGGENGIGGVVYMPIERDKEGGKLADGHIRKPFPFMFESSEDEIL